MIALAASLYGDGSAPIICGEIVNKAPITTVIKFDQFIAFIEMRRCGRN